jgi:cytochrome c553
MSTKSMVFAVIIVTALPAVGSAQNVPPDWMFPGPGAGGPANKPDDPTLRHMPGSKAAFTDAALHDLSRAVDWHPDEHPPMPPPVAIGQNGANACGFCHLPGGEGRPENAALAGLPAGYIRRQLAAFASGARQGMQPHWGPTAYMIETAKSAKPEAVAAAADYFSRLRFTSRVRVVEGDVAPQAVQSGFVYRTLPAQSAPLGERIVETPTSFERFEMRDPHMTYIAYVPAGSVARGAALALKGGSAGPPCATCHGVGLRGDLGPPLAGRSPTYLVRQLMAFQHGSRTDIEAAPMRQVTAKLTVRDMVDLAAYAATLKP